MVTKMQSTTDCMSIKHLQILREANNIACHWLYLHIVNLSAHLYLYTLIKLNFTRWFISSCKVSTSFPTKWPTRCSISSCKMSTSFPTMCPTVIISCKLAKPSLINYKNLHITSIGPVRFAESRNTIPTDLLWEKNTDPAKKTSWKVLIIREANKAIMCNTFKS